MLYSDKKSFWVTLFNLNYKFPINESNDKLAFGKGKLDFERNKLAFEADALEPVKGHRKGQYKFK